MNQLLRLLHISILNLEVAWDVALERHDLITGGQKGVIGQTNQITCIFVMAVVVVCVLHIAVSVWPSVIDGPVRFVVRLNVLESILLSVWIIIFMTVFGRVDPLSGEWLGGVARILSRLAFLLVGERVCFD